MGTDPNQPGPARMEVPTLEHAAVSQIHLIGGEKGGVGKSTISLGLAETIVCETPLTVLLIDADPQGSLTAMMDLENDTPRTDRITLVSLLSAALTLALALPTHAREVASQHLNPEAASSVMQRDKLVTHAIREAYASARRTVHGA